MRTQGVQDTWYSRSVPAETDRVQRIPRAPFIVAASTLAGHLAAACLLAVNGCDPPGRLTEGRDAALHAMPDAAPTAAEPSSSSSFELAIPCSTGDADGAALASTDSAAEAHAVEASNLCAWELHSRLVEDDKNLLYSPASLTFGLSMVLAGARGETKKEMERVLHSDPSDSTLSGLRASASVSAHGARRHDYCRRRPDLDSGRSRASIRVRLHDCAVFCWVDRVGRLRTSASFLTAATRNQFRRRLRN
jgi:hypothetical protein